MKRKNILLAAVIIAAVFGFRGVFPDTANNIKAAIAGVFSRDIDYKEVFFDLGNAVPAFLGGKEKEIEYKHWSDISLAYSMTIHKSQGSEYDSVIIALPSSATNMWQRNLLYTAITRAKKHVTIVCQPDAIECAAQNTKTTNRRTTLKELLCA